MPGRSYSIGSEYRYGFNGKEKDAETRTQDYGMRIYDERLGRFLSVDPLARKYQMLTPYQFASNCPISGIDVDGKEFYYAADGTLLGNTKDKNTQVMLVNADKVKEVTSMIRAGNATVAKLNTMSTSVGMTNDELNTRAFLVTLRNSESDGGAPTSYDAQFGMRTFKGKDLNNDGKISDKEKFNDHPRESVSRWGLTADVAGAYQFKASSWDRIKKKLNLDDFSPANQDKGALQLIRWQEQDNPRAKGVVADITSGSFISAMRKLNGTWTSLPEGKEKLIFWKEAIDLFKQNFVKELTGKSDLAAPKGQAKF